VKIDRVGMLRQPEPFRMNSIRHHVPEIVQAAEDKRPDRH